VFDATHISYDEASGVSDDVIRSLPCDLVVKVPECEASLALHAFSCCNESAVFARAGLATADLALQGTDGLVPLSLDRTCFAAVDDGDVNGLLIYPSRKCHWIDDAFVYSCDRFAS
jgi:hypothetical protein